MLLEEHEEQVTVDVPTDGGFADRVAEELEKLGHRVTRDPIKEGRLTIFRKGPE